MPLLNLQHNFQKLASIPGQNQHLPSTGSCRMNAIYSQGWMYQGASRHQGQVLLWRSCSPSTAPAGIPTQLLKKLLPFSPSSQRSQASTKVEAAQETGAGKADRSSRGVYPALGGMSRSENTAFSTAKEQEFSFQSVFSYSWILSICGAKSCCHKHCTALSKAGGQGRQEECCALLRSPTNIPFLQYSTANWQTQLPGLWYFINLLNYPNVCKNCCHFATCFLFHLSCIMQKWQEVGRKVRKANQSHSGVQLTQNFSFTGQFWLGKHNDSFTPKYKWEGIHLHY